MSKMLASQITVAVTAALFLAATWMTQSMEPRTAPTTLVLTHEEPEVQVATLENGSRI